MKKNLFLLGLAVAAMTSCTNDEVLDVQQPVQKAIGFEGFVNKATRAVKTTDNYITKFFAYGYYEQPDKTVAGSTTTNVFNNLTVTKVEDEDEGIKWSYDLDSNTNGDQLAYWTKNKYWFAGIAKGNTDDNLTSVSFAEATKTSGTTTTKKGELTISNYTVGEDDIVASVVCIDNSNHNPVTNSAVNMTFGHLLTKVKFTVHNNDSKYKMRITSPLTITSINKTGTCIVSSDGPVWSDLSNNNTDFLPKDENGNDNNVGVTGSTEFIAKTLSKTSQDYFVLPQDLANIKFSIQATFYDNNDQIVAVKTLENITIDPATQDGNNSYVKQGSWKNGTYYHYTISLPTSAKPISFGSIGVTDWGNAIPIQLNPGDDGTNGQPNAPSGN